MSQKLQLSVVDQSPMREGSSAGVALRETIQLAQATEAMGYERYWVAEHHNLPNFAGTAPEVLVGQIAANTRRIRVGSGGVMLSHYSSLKVAETFRMLDAFYPGRIDLGIGRAPGSDQITAAALAYPSTPKDIRHFPQQVRDVVNYLNDSQPDDHPFNAVAASPDEPDTAPQVWLLGSRYESAFMAAKMGLPFAYAHFFGMGADDGPQIVESYRQNFEASEHLEQPLVNVGVQVLCADTEEEARRIGSSRNLGRLRSVQGSSQRHSIAGVGCFVQISGQRVAIYTAVSPQLRGRRPGRGESRAGASFGTVPNRRSERGYHLLPLRRPRALLRTGGAGVRAGAARPGLKTGATARGCQPRLPVNVAGFG